MSALGEVPSWFRSRRRSKRILFYCLAALAFLLCWSLFTILLLLVQEQLLAPLERRSTTIDPDSYAGRGVQVVVGHYSGNLPAEKLANLTEEELNANNYDPRDGAGDHGSAVRLSPEEDRLSDDTFGINQFNLLISDQISINRSLPDVRKSHCREREYPAVSELPTTSVIIVYHNEAFSTLLRTVMSVVNRSPKEVLKEIILVDDCSSRAFLKAELDRFMLGLRVKVKIVRAKQRVGLIRARMMGAQEAEGDVLTFLDSHCECTKGWLEPLLARIKENRKAVVCPVIDVINDRTFAYQKGIELFRGGFNWNLQFRWYSVPPKISKERSKDPTAPIDSPTMAGGLFSIERGYFEELGTYDPGMDIWGGENIEISFRIWQCGGRVEILPCSHVGHIFRKASPHDFPKGKSSGKVLNGNLVRVADVWMDEWKHFFYKTAPQALQMSKSIDVSERVELRKRLHCKDFNWYLQNVWPDHFLPRPDTLFGRISHSASAAADDPPCLHWTSAAGGGSKRASLHNCSAAAAAFDRTELWIYSPEGQLKSDEHQCLSASKVTHTNGQWTVQLKECGEYPHEFWDYNSYRRSLTHRASGLCLDQPLESFRDSTSGLVRTPTLRKCSRGGRTQQWEFAAVQWLPDDFSSTLESF